MFNDSEQREMPLGSSRSQFNETRKIEIVYLSQDVQQQIPTVRYHVLNTGNYFGGATIGKEEALEYLNKYRKLGVVFGLSWGGGDVDKTSTFSNIATYDDIHFGETFGGPNPPLSVYGGFTGIIEQMCGATPNLSSRSGEKYEAFASSDTPIRLEYDWMNINIEPLFGINHILRGFAGDYTTQDKPIEPGGYTIGVTGGPFVNPQFGKRWTDARTNLYFGEAVEELRTGTIQSLKCYEQWIVQGAMGKNPNKEPVTLELGYDNTKEPKVRFNNPNVVEYPSYYNMYKMQGYFINKTTDFCRTYTKNVLNFNKIPKMMIWWQPTTKPMPLAGSGWFNNPVAIAGDQISFGYGSLTANAYSLRAFGATTIGKICYAPASDARNPSSPSYMLITGAPNQGEPWNGSTASYPLNSHHNRSVSMAFEGASNSAHVFLNTKDLDCVVFQYYWGVYGDDWRTLTATANWDFTSFTGNIAGQGELYRFWGPARYGSGVTGLTLGPVVGDGVGELFLLPKQDVETAHYRAFRLNYLSYRKYFGENCAPGLEPCMDLFLPQNSHQGLATDHDTFERVFLKALYDPITSEEARLHGFRVGEVLRPKYFVFWSAEYYYLLQAFGPTSSETLTQANKDQINGYLRKNLQRRFPPSVGMSVNWRQGSEWHRHLCRKLDDFTLERIQRIREYDSSKSIRSSQTFSPPAEGE